MKLSLIKQILSLKMIKYEDKIYVLHPKYKDMQRQIIEDFKIIKNPRIRFHRAEGVEVELIGIDQPFLPKNYLSLWSKFKYRKALLWAFSHFQVYLEKTKI